MKTNTSTSYLTTSRYSSGRKIGTLCRTVRRIKSKQMGPLCHSRRFQDPIQFPFSSIYSSDKSESIFLPVLMRRNKNGTSPLRGSGKGNRSGNSWFLLPAMSFTQERTKCPLIDLSILIYIRKQPFKT